MNSSSKTEAVRNFRAHWKAIAESDLYFCDKDETPHDSDILYNGCYLCDYVWPSCELCPINWGKRICAIEGAVYAKWYSIMSTYNWGDGHPWHNRVLPSGARTLARIISNLPEKE